tara:strand:- start:506 stop:823 length:318 start_codon:yes stop_codon:yes gene_type:complete
MSLKRGKKRKRNKNIGRTLSLDTNSRNVSESELKAITELQEIFKGIEYPLNNPSLKVIREDIYFKPIDKVTIGGKRKTRRKKRRRKRKTRRKKRRRKRKTKKRRK